MAVRFAWWWLVYLLVFVLVGAVGRITGNDFVCSLGGVMVLGGVLAPPLVLAIACIYGAGWGRGV